MKKISTISFSNWGIILFIVGVILMIVALTKTYYNNRHHDREGFSQSGQFINKEGSAVYDHFYADIYDHLVYNQLKDQFEIGEIINQTQPTTESIILDIGSGTGHHVALLESQNFRTTGVDISPAMVNKAKQNYPQYNFIQGDVLNSGVFQNDSFTHILCLYFTMYYFKDKRQFFNNCMKWLKPGGYLVVHLVNREQFDPILPPANPLFLVSPQKYAKERITKSKVVFNNMEYVANFHLEKDKNVATFNEKCTNNSSGKVRKNKHIFYMEPDKEIVAKAKLAGFIEEGKIDLLRVGYEYQYLYVFTKPN
jgi:SAM-dependent methyltransferase